jgi:hypothetical protein
MELIGRLPPDGPSMLAAPETGSVFTPAVIWGSPDVFVDG